MSEQQNDLVVIDHHHDAENGVYRLTVGVPVQHEVPMTDEKGEPVFEAIALRDGEGNVAKDVDGKEVYLPGAQRFETTILYEPGATIVFADDDDRWKGKSPEDIAAEQRADVKAQMDERAAESAKAEAARASLVQLPGSGEAL